MESMNGSRLGRFLEELCFLFSIVVAVVLTVIDIFVGLVRYVWKRKRHHYPNFNPWKETCNMWAMIGGHVAFEWKKFTDIDFRRHVKAQRQSMHAAAIAMRSSLRGATQSITPDFEYVDAEMFLAYFWPTVTYGWLLFELVISFVGALAYPGMRYYASTQQVTTPRQETHIVYQPQTADKQDADFGPWRGEGEVFKELHTSTFRNILMLNELGEVKASPDKVGTLDGFQLLGFSDRIVNPRVSRDGRIDFHDPHQQSFSVNPDEVFMFEGYDSQAFYLNARAQLYAIPLGRLTFTKK
jgi:hypothetical protein